MNKEEILAECMCVAESNIREMILDDSPKLEFDENYHYYSNDGNFVKIIKMAVDLSFEQSRTQTLNEVKEKIEECAIVTKFGFVWINKQELLSSLEDKNDNQQKVEFSDDRKARTKSHLVHSQAEKVEVFNPPKSADTPNLCKNCGFPKHRHPVEYCKIEGIQRVDKLCKKFIPQDEQGEK